MFMTFAFKFRLNEIQRAKMIEEGRQRQQEQEQEQQQGQ